MARGAEGRAAGASAEAEGRTAAGDSAKGWWSHRNRKDTESMGSAFLPPGKDDMATRMDNRVG